LEPETRQNSAQKLNPEKKNSVDLELAHLDTNRPLKDD
jgi:hypothetical protein